MPRENSAAGLQVSATRSAMSVASGPRQAMRFARTVDSSEPAGSSTASRPSLRATTTESTSSSAVSVARKAIPAPAATAASVAAIASRRPARRLVPRGGVGGIAAAGFASIEVIQKLRPTEKCRRTLLSRSP